MHKYAPGRYYRKARNAQGRTDRQQKRVGPRCAAPKAAGREIEHPVFTRYVTVEDRTGSDIRTRTVLRTQAFTHVHGSIRDTSCNCNPAFRHKLDTWYGKIDADIQKWDYERRLALGVPQAVRAHKEERKAVDALRSLKRGKGKGVR